MFHSSFVIIFLFPLNHPDPISFVMKYHHQIVYYKSDGRYYGHHDYIDRDLNSYYRGGGNRLVTLLYYLSDVDQVCLYYSNQR